MNYRNGVVKGICSNCANARNDEKLTGARRINGANKR